MNRRFADLPDPLRPMAFAPPRSGAHIDLPLESPRLAAAPEPIPFPDPAVADRARQRRLAPERAIEHELGREAQVRELRETSDDSLTIALRAARSAGLLQGVRQGRGAGWRSGFRWGAALFGLAGLGGGWLIAVVAIQLGRLS